MAKLKNIIRQLSENDYQSIYKALIESSADKSANLLRSMREKHQSDAKMMEELGVNTNAYYTLRSRLNQRIEEYLLQQMENPRADILKKVSNINEILFTKKRDIAVATLKKLEKELLDYDLSNELTVVYKSLKKLHINSSDFFSYSQNYNKHVAYTLAVDKAEDLLAEYFKKYGLSILKGRVERQDLELKLLSREINNVCALYESHRLYVYKSSLNIFHRLFVDHDEEMEMELEPIEDILAEIYRIFNLFELDVNYYHLKNVFEFLRYEYYSHYRVYRKAEEFYDAVNESIPSLLTNYTLYTFPGQFMISKIQRHRRMNTLDMIYDENEGLFYDYECDTNDIANYYIYCSYRSLSAYYVKNYEEAAKWLNHLLNEVGIKKYPYAQLEIKLLLALQYCLLDDYDLFNQLISSIQRQMRILGKETCDHLFLFSKILKISQSDAKKNKPQKIRELVEKMNQYKYLYFMPTLHVPFDDDLINSLSRI